VLTEGFDMSSEVLLFAFRDFETGNHAAAAEDNVFADLWLAEVHGWRSMESLFFLHLLIRPLCLNFIFPEDASGHISTPSKRRYTARFFA
jgi:hypothetical protein